MYKINITGFRYSRACRIRKYQIENRLPSLALPLPTFSKPDFYFIKCYSSKTVWDVFCGLKNVKIADKG
jgi:hypothetical protein